MLISHISWISLMKQRCDATKFLGGYRYLIWHDNIFKYLSFLDIYNLRFVSKDFNGLVMDYKRYIGH